MQKADIIIVGAGISGAVLAERYATQLGKKVLVIEKRSHIGGHCYDYIDPYGILVPKYGPHFFHTNDKEVWKYVSQFTKWHPYEHRVLSYIDNLFVPIPVNITTVNILFKLNIRNEEEMKLWLQKNTRKIDNPKNSEESALRRVGPIIYEKMFKGYTIKQWGIHPKNIHPSVMDRIPVRTNFDDRYFTDTYQALPNPNYSQIFKNMFKHPNITVMLNADYLKIKNQIKDGKKLFFSGPIDSFFDYRFGHLQYRSLSFKYENYKKRYFQTKAQINYPNDFTYTRITEPKHATGQRHKTTTIIREFSRETGPPYYPIPTSKNQLIYQKYFKEAKKLQKKGIYFIGRLAEYKYINMDQAFRNALNLFEKLESKRHL